MKKITIKDVAKKAGVSVGSVHLAINNKSGISDKNKTHILEVAKKLGYSPNVMASNLKREQRNIAILLPEKDSRSVYYYHYMWDAVDDFQQLASVYNLNLIKYKYVDFAEKINEIDFENISGLITVGYPENDYKKAMASVNKKKIPVLLIDDDFEDVERICCIKPNTQIIGQLTGELLLNTIHQLSGKILVCGGEKNYPNHYEIVNSLVDYLHNNHLDNRIIEENFFIVDDATNNSLKNILRNNNIIGCCAVNSRSTIALSKAIDECGLSQKIPVIGNGLFDSSIEYMKKGTLTAVISKRPYNQCYDALVTLSDLLVKNISPADTIIDIGVDVIFKSLLPQYEKKTMRT